MAGLRLKVGAQTYEVGPLTLGEHRAAKRIYGVADMSDLLQGDPDAVAAFIFTALHRAEPATDVDILVKRVDSLDLSDVEISDPDEPKDETVVDVDPTPAPADEDGASVPVKAGKPRKGSKASS